MLNALKYFLGALAVLSLVFSFGPASYALQVKSVDAANNLLTLDDARVVRLAGIELIPEAGKTLSVIFANKDIEIEEEKSVSLDPSHSEVYIWIHAFEMDLPFKPNLPARDSKLLVNELLLSLGAAKVKEFENFKMKDSFLKAQETAHLAGKGVWSFEPFQIKKKQ